MLESRTAYVDAGAEIVFPEAVHDEKDFEQVRKSKLKRNLKKGIF